MLMSSNSFFTSFVTFVCFLSSVLTPSNRRRRNRLISSSEGRDAVSNRVSDLPHKGKTIVTGVDFGQFADCTQDLADESISSAKSGIYPGPDTDQSPRHGELQQIVLGMKGHDATKNGFAFVPASAILRDDAGSNFYFLSESEDAREDGTTGHAAFKFVDFSTRFVDVE